MSVVPLPNVSIGLVALELCGVIPIYDDVSVRMRGKQKRLFLTL